MPLYSFLGAVLAAGSLLLGFTLPAEAKPNLLVVLADDMGWGDLGFLGSETIETPHLDALAERGVFCSQAYVPSSVCSPSRAGILTGRDPRRFGYQANLNQSAGNYGTRPELLGLAPGEHTLADHLGAAGYATALIGKWHLGTGDGFHPLERGFDHFCGMLVGSHDYFPDPDQNRLERNREPITKFSKPYLTDFFTDEALAWIGEAGESDDPWFAFLSYNAPHTPMQATEEDLARFDSIEDPKRRTYTAMMYALDRSVGRVVDFLESRDRLEDTLIVFFSDNGGATNNGSWNGPLSGVKGTLREGGVRVPMIWSWPTRIPAGRTMAAPVSALDLLPTFLAAAEAKPLPLREPMSHEDARTWRRGIKAYGAYDGVDLLPALANEADALAELADRRFFWRLQGQAAVRIGDRKLIRLSHRPAQLFAPGSDPGEQSDLSAGEPETRARLYRELADWEASLPTVPLWGSSPRWSGVSARHYDEWAPTIEPK